MRDFRVLVLVSCTLVLCNTLMHFCLLLVSIDLIRSKLLQILGYATLDLLDDDGQFLFLGAQLTSMCNTCLRTWVVRVGWVSNIILWSNWHICDLFVLQRREARKVALQEQKPKAVVEDGNETEAEEPEQTEDDSLKVAGECSESNFWNWNSWSKPCW